MRYLVTGGAGFIGSHLVERLLKYGHYVTVLDDLSTGSYQNLDLVINNDRLNFEIGSVQDASVFGALGDFDAIIHLAASVGVFNVMNDPVKTIDNNVVGTKNVLEAALERNAHILLASTSEVYGHGVKVPFRENDNLIVGCPESIRWCYAASKLVDEFMALAYAKKYKLPATIMRFFNVVGERQSGKWGMVVPRFIEQATSGNPITVFGDGKQSRCFAYIKDVVSGILILLQDQITSIYNIGSDEEITIDDLAYLVKKEVNPDAKIDYVPYEKAYGRGFEDMQRRVPDLRKIKSMGYNTSYSVRDIVRRLSDGR
jgi:UDP-glucose 4-epimerase